jgi:methionyl aminopeptidase
VVRAYCGHCIGTVHHDEPQVLHERQPGTGLARQPGLVFTNEPMLNTGGSETRPLSDGRTAITKDRSLPAQWEHMLAVTGKGSRC